MKKTWTSRSEEETADIANQVLKLIPEHSIICLSGNLGAGKTSFSRSFIRAFTKDKNITVPSPTYNLVQTYDDDALWHFDLYRLDHPEQIYDIGWEEALCAKYCLIEWPCKLGRLKPKKTVDITIDILPDHHRRITLEQ